jgi:replicative DNA helicase
MSSDSLKHIPPHNLEAERSVLGALMLDKEAIIKVADILRPDDFYHEGNAIIFRAILELFNRHTPIDILTLTSLLSDQDNLVKVGGASYLASLPAEVPTASHVFQYATLVVEKATLRRLVMAGQSITALGYDENEEIENLLDRSEQTLFAVSGNFVKDKFIHIKDVLAGTYEKIAELHDPEQRGKYQGLSTGFKSLDNILTGLQPSDLVILAARPAMGKTAFALNIAQNVAEQTQSVGVISLEMSKEQLVERMFCSLLEVDSWKIKSGKLNDSDFARIGPIMDKLNSYRIYIDDSLGSSIVELRAKARRLQMEHGLDLLIIDYLQLMHAGSHGSMISNRVQEISEISRSLKALARELHIPIIALSQLSRAVETRVNKRPQLSDLRESGSIEQDADVVMMLYREDYYDEDTDKKGITEILINKHRNGPIGTIELVFQKEKLRFYEIDRVHRELDSHGSGPANFQDDYATMSPPPEFSVPYDL